jgi:hypothetical protein
MLNECWIATLSWSKIALCAHFEYDVALHVDTTTSADGTYEISQKSAEDIPEDQVNVTKGLSEALNQSLEDNNTNIPDSSPTSKGNLMHESRRWNGTLDAWILGFQITTLCNFILIYYILH